MENVDQSIKRSKERLNHYLDLWWCRSIACTRFDDNLEETDEWIEKYTETLSTEEKCILKDHIDSRKSTIVMPY